MLKATTAEAIAKIRNITFQVEKASINPPMGGPARIPIVHPAEAMPIDFPLAFFGATSTAMACARPAVIAPPIPCSILNATSWVLSSAKKAKRLPMPKIDIPIRRSLLRPYMSASLPIGIESALATREYPNMTHITMNNEDPRSCAILGSARTIDRLEAPARKLTLDRTNTMRQYFSLEGSIAINRFVRCSRKGCFSEPYYRN